jgi:hypothetical protein
MMRHSILAVLTVSIVAGVSFAEHKTSESDQWKKIHRNDDVKWARISGLSVEEISNLRRASGITDDMTEGRIDEVDAKHLSFRKQILLVTSAGNGHCLTLTALSNKSGSWEQVWQASEMPNGDGFCHESLSGNPVAYAKKTGEIVVKIPKKQTDGKQVDLLVKYTWTGETYQFSETQHVTVTPNKRKLR